MELCLKISGDAWLLSEERSLECMLSLSNRLLFFNVKAFIFYLLKYGWYTILISGV